MGAMASLAVQLAELNQHYMSHSLDPSVLEKLQEAVRHVEPEQPTPAPSHQPGPQGVRFHVHEVQLYAAQDNLVWTHTQLVSPCDNISLVVPQGHATSY